MSNQLKWQRWFVGSYEVESDTGSLAGWGAS